MQRLVVDDLDALLNVLPPHIREPLEKQPDRNSLIEVILDLGRSPEARYPDRELILSPREVSADDIDYVVTRISSFGGDNRAGIERTLHRISAICNREGRIVGLTCRVGRAVFGTIKIIQDLIQSDKSILLLGRPGVGKTTMLREIARVLADDFKKRVVVVDTSNEIAGDGDIPHPAIGHARRMQVSTPTKQHAVMIEAVENHMPETIIIDEIGTELEAQAARTIGERGVQLIGTAHGNTLENLMMNPTLSDLIGGIQSVTLSDEEARRRGTQKSILERKAPPTFDIVVEIQERDRVVVHPDVGAAVDALLRGQPPNAELRMVDKNGKVKREKMVSPPVPVVLPKAEMLPETKIPRLYPFGINQSRLEEAAKELRVPIEIVTDLKQANLFITSKNYYRRKPQKIRDAEATGIPIYVIKSNTLSQMKQCLNHICLPGMTATVERALAEVKDAITRVKNGAGSIELHPQNPYIRRLQHLLIQSHNLASHSLGKKPSRRVKIFSAEKT